MCPTQQPPLRVYGYNKRRYGRMSLIPCVNTLTFHKLSHVKFKVTDFGKKGQADQVSLLTAQLIGL